VEVWHFRSAQIKSGDGAVGSADDDGVGGDPGKTSYYFVWKMKRVCCGGVFYCCLLVVAGPARRVSIRKSQPSASGEEES
jgi:hypothetical protein